MKDPWSKANGGMIEGGAEEISGGKMKTTELE